MQELTSRDMVAFFAHTESLPVRVQFAGMMYPLEGVSFDPFAEVFVISVTAPSPPGASVDGYAQGVGDAVRDAGRRRRTPGSSGRV